MEMTMFRSRASTPDLRSNSLANKTKPDILPDLIFKKWGKRRHLMSLFTLIALTSYSFWATLMKIPSSAGLPLSIWLDDSSAMSRTASDVTTSLTSTHMTPSSLRGPSISHSIPLPLPKEKVSVVLMNFSRPRMIRESSMMRVSLL